MATARTVSAKGHSGQGQSGWIEHFDEAERKRMAHEDAVAFAIVSGELLAIVCVGFVLVGLTVAMILLGG